MKEIIVLTVIVLTTATFIAFLKRNKKVSGKKEDKEVIVKKEDKPIISVPRKKHK